MNPHDIIQLGLITVTVEQVLYVGCLLCSYLFSFIYYHFLLFSKTEWVKHLYMVLVSNAFLLICFPLSSLSLLYLPMVVTFFLVRSYRKAWWMPAVNFIVVLSVLTVAHLRRQFWDDPDIDYYSLDITGPLMMITIKLTSFAFDMRDSITWLQRGPSHPAPSSGKTLSSDQLDKVPASSKQSRIPLVEPAVRNSTLKRYPSFLEFCAYVLLFPGVLTGPTMPFYEYRTFINGTYFAGVDTIKGSLPGRKRRAFYLFMSAVVFMCFYVSLQGIFTASYLTDAEFLARPIWWRVLYIHLVNMVSRSKYYFAWMIAEGSYVIIGLGFRLSAARKPLWDRLENINPFRIETATDFKLLIGQWNVCTNNWLHAYVYRRIQGYYGKGSSSARASVATYIVSALWHGFYPGYYLTFASAALLTIAARLVYKTIVWPFGSLSRRLLIFVPLFLLIDYIATPFILLDWRRSVGFWASLGFFGHIVIVLLLGGCLAWQRLQEMSPKKKNQ